MRWAYRFGGDYSDTVEGIAVKPDDQVVVGGYLSEAVTLGSVSLSPEGFVLTTTP